TVLDAFAHQDVPFERLVDALQPARDTSRTPLFDAMIVLQNTPERASELPGLQAEDVELPMVTAHFDLSIGFQELDGALYGSLAYNTDLFDADTIERMVGHLQRLLAGIAAEPDRLVGELSMMTQAETHQVLEAWNDTDREVPAATLPELFAEQVARTPQATAVMTGEVSLSYAELEARANRLAWLLMERGVGPERFVALALPRSVEIVVAQLAVLKAGAAFLPVDPAYPPDRIGFMLADARPVLVLTLAEIVPQLSFPEGVAVLVVDDLQTLVVLEQMPDRAVTDADRISPLLVGHAAYVIYTSGSTGWPKGVVVSHTGLASFSAAEVERYSVAAGDRVLQFSSPSFDASVLELCMSLPTGAALVVPPPGPL
ncbi:MAG: AMP-binding protein, partial [Actinobacteria bacterium]|nr:AMP-binding protein [Actinomycetota bacterium]